MPETSYEVAAILAVADRATGPMGQVLELSRAIVREFERIKVLGKGLFADTGASRFATQLGRVDPALDKITAQMKATRDVTVAAFGDMTAATGPMLDMARALKAELVEAAAAAKTLRVPAGAGGAGGGGSGEGGPRVTGPVVPGGHTSNMLALAAGGAAAYGAYEDSKLRYAVARALSLSGIPLTGDMSHTKEFAGLRKQILDVYSETGAPIEEIEEAALSSVKLMAGFPLEKRMEVLKTALTFGAQEHTLNPNVSVPQGADALIALLHMTGTYDPAEIAKFTPKIAALSTITNMPLSSLMRAASYAMPIAQANLGVDSDQILLLMTAMQRAGVTNTKSGTWLREAITKTVTDTFTLSAHGSAAQRAGLSELGLLDKEGRSTVIDAAGHLDLMKEMEILNQARGRLQGPNISNRCARRSARKAARAGRY
jgi:hypothetical protein